MSIITISCSHCFKKFNRDFRQIKENIKLQHNSFCSSPCLVQSRTKRRKVRCENPSCNKIFDKLPSQIISHNYCSRSCSASVNNKKFPKILGIRKICIICQKFFIGREKYCSLKCNIKGKTISPDTLISQIKNFYKSNGRIPLKKEFQSARAARERFGSWNKAIETAGFIPNPVMFAKKYIAKDGHKCDSLAEKIIDDWLYRREVVHRRSVSYPGKPTFTVDFVVNDYWIEFFGLYGEHRRYDELREEKLHLAKSNNLKLIELYPKHLFPINRLPEALNLILQ